MEPDIIEGLTEEEAKEIKDAFSLFDKNGDGYICKGELGGVLRCLGQNPTMKTIEEYMARADTDGSGKLSYEEFERLVDGKLLKKDEVEVKLRQAFSVFDRDKNQKLDCKELFDVLTSRGECLTRAEAEEILKLADTNGDGTLDVNEFTKFLCERI